MIYLLLAVAILIVLLFFASVNIKFFYAEGIFTLEISLLGINIYTYTNRETSSNAPPEVQAETLEKKSDSALSKIRKITKISRTAARLMKTRVSVEEAEINIRIGTGDAAVTAVSTGALWAAAYNFLGVVGRLMYIKKHEVQIVPDYANSVFLPDVKCIIKSRVVYIIIIAITIFSILKEE